VPLDPVSWDVLQRCLAHRDAQATDNPRVMATRVTRARDIGDPEAREVADDFTGKYGGLFRSAPPESGPNP
jgi:hypothetical protein